ncbi:PRC-barrel domain-containing protein [Kitasatospora cineracea]|uniref:PRC-barrel domain-containing protein n=1 Tax=Kitasatospora cineracea TaxID=88074 RepID=UPI0037A5609F
MKASDFSAREKMDLVSKDGIRIGRITAVHVHRQTARAVFAEVDTRDGSGRLLVPLTGSKVIEGDLVVPYGSERMAKGVKSVPGRRITGRVARNVLTQYGLSQKREIPEDFKNRHRGAVSRRRKSGRSEEPKRSGPVEIITLPPIVYPKPSVVEEIDPHDGA